MHSVIVHEKWECFTGLTTLTVELAANFFRCVYLKRCQVGAFSKFHILPVDFELSDVVKAFYKPAACN